MSASLPRDRVRSALDLLKPFLASFVASTVSSASRQQGLERADVQGLLGTILANWETVFSARMGKTARHYVFELKDVRNRWAHEEEFSSDDARRAIDTAALLAQSIRAPATVVATIRTLAESTRDEREVSKPSAPGKAKSRSRPTQRSVMLRIYEKYAPDEARIVREYAAAELRGEVQRVRNESGLSGEEYARALLADGRKRGWLPSKGL